MRVFEELKRERNVRRMRAERRLCLPVRVGTKVGPTCMRCLTFSQRTAGFLWPLPRWSNRWLRRQTKQLGLAWPLDRRSTSWNKIGYHSRLPCTVLLRESGISSGRPSNRPTMQFLTKRLIASARISFSDSV